MANRPPGQPPAGQAGGPSQQPDPYKNNIDAPSFRRGGKIPKTGLYRLHKGEKVTPARRKR